MKEFESTIKKIFHFVAEYGITNKPLDLRNRDDISEEDLNEFFIQVHKGFRIGQDLIVKEIIPLLKELKSEKENEKEAKRSKNKDLLNEILSKQNLIEYKIKLLRHFADFIAWQVFSNDYYKARRFYSGDKNRPDLLNSNLESVLLAVESFHKESDETFALITDLTTFIDIGDILLVKRKELSIVECKTGDVQKRVFDFLTEASREDFDVTNVDYTDKNQKFFDQVERTLKQIKKGNRAIEFLKNEEGKDPFSESNIKVREATKPREYYFEYLYHLIEESKQNEFAYGEIEEIIYIGIYRESRAKIGPFIFKGIVDHIYAKNIICNYMSLIGLPLKEPIFFKPLGEETLFDLMFGRLKIVLAINLDKLMELFNSKGVEANWLSKKETHKIIDESDSYKPFLYKNQAIEVVVKGERVVLGDSFLIYLLLDNITPSSYVDRFVHVK